VFIVEDDQSARTFLKRLLCLSGFKVMSAAKNGEEAVKLFKSFINKPDIILLDHRMPVKNGIKTTKEILKIENKSKIVFMSADSSIKEKALLLGALDFIEKPFSIDFLIETIKKYV